MLHNEDVRHHISEKQRIGGLRGGVKYLRRTSFRLRQVRQAFKRDENK